MIDKKTVKKCNMCKKTLPIDNFQLVRCKRYPYSRRGKCIPCEREYRLTKKRTFDQYTKEQTFREELHILQKKGQRRCRRCNTIKVLDEFHNDSSPKVLYNKKSTCKKCAYEVWRKPYSKTRKYKKLKYESDKRHRIKHKDKINAQLKEKYHTDSRYKLKCNLRTRLGQALRNHNSGKSVSALELVGCDIEFLKEYLESKFSHGMTWDNWSKHGWHIDHIVPLDAFDLSNPEEQRKAMHYTNLQPLWASENLKKSNNILDKPR